MYLSNIESKERLETVRHPFNIKKNRAFIL